MHNTAHKSAPCLPALDICAQTHPMLGRFPKVNHHTHRLAETPIEPDETLITSNLKRASFCGIHREFMNSLSSAPAKVANISTGITLFHADPNPTFDLPIRPLRVVFLTSIRDVGADEKVGRYAGEKKYARYLKGTIEHIIHSTREGRLNGYCEVVGIISDDLPADLQKSPFGELPSEGKWIFPKHLVTSEGKRAMDICTNIPSEFRKLPLSAVAKRQEMKLEFEIRVANVMGDLNADVLVTDHYMARLDYLVDPKSPISSIVMNTHPGIIREDYAYSSRGKDPYNDVISMAQQLELESDGVSGFRKPMLYTGATFHVSDAGIDSGPILCEVACTPVYPNDTEENVCRRNYHFSKNLACELGLFHFSSHLFQY